MKSNRHTRVNSSPPSIHVKANRILSLVLLAMGLIILRCWHLSIIQHEDRAEAARRPQRRVVMEPAKRGTIRDRFNIPLAINKMQYNVGVLYSEIRHIPSIVWVKGPDGKKVRHFKRREYISKLAEVLGKELGLNSERVEDMIHSKASLYYNIPFILKEDITEQEYYRLKMLEKDWLGIQMQRTPRRFYPKEKVAGDIIGYMGAISRREYDAIVQEIKALQTYIAAREEGEVPPLPEGIESPLMARQRLKELKSRAYRATDYVGKMGIEGQFEENLRGFQGKKIYYSDARGNFLRELPGEVKPLAGQRVLLTISSELQEYAEKLLVQNESTRSARISGIGKAQQELLKLKDPWIRGGAIVAMDPNTGEVLALASFPRFDPNDFIKSGDEAENKVKQSNIRHWFEHEKYLGEIWDQEQPLKRERYDNELRKFYDDALWMTWNNYLDAILPNSNPVRKVMREIHTVEEAVLLQGYVEKLLELSGQNNAYWLFNALYPNDEPHNQRIPAVTKDILEEHFLSNAQEIEQIKNHLTPYFARVSNNYDKVLFVDLCRLAVRGDLFSYELLEAVGGKGLTSYRNDCSAYVTVNHTLRTMAKNLYHAIRFKPWREENTKQFLKEKREEEKEAHRYAKPYIDLLDQKEEEMFEAFWQENRFKILVTILKGASAEESDPFIQHFSTWHEELVRGAHKALPWRKAYDKLQWSLISLSDDLSEEYLRTLRRFEDLNRPLLGYYRQLHHRKRIQLEKHLATAFYPVYGYGYARSQAYRQATPQGSIFKLVTAYAALNQKYKELDTGEITTEKLNPLVINDHYYRIKGQVYLGLMADGKKIPQLYNGGCLPKSLSPLIGKLDITRALETSSNVYFSLLGGDVLHNPEDLLSAARLFSYGSRTGIDLPLEIPGKLPRDIHFNRTGLYTTAIGQHTLVVTPLQTNTMLSAIANGGTVVKPKIVNIVAGRAPTNNQDLLIRKQEFAFREDLAMLGIDFPLLTAAEARDPKNRVIQLPNEAKRHIFMPDVVRQVLLDGMSRVYTRALDKSLISLSQLYQEHPEAIADMLGLEKQIVGKTSTAEAVEHICLDKKYGTNKYNHVWFGAIAFDEDTDTTESQYGKPELVVVVYLRYGGYGKDAIPIAAQMVQKWRDIKLRRS